MDNRETLTPSSGDAILKRHLFSEVARNWIKGRGQIERAYFVRRLSRQSFGFRVAASSGPIPKAPGSAGGYLHDLFLDATAFDTSCGDPDDPDRVHYDPFDDDPGDTQTTSKWSLRSTPTLYEDGPEEGLEDGSEANFGTLEQTPPEASGRSQRK